MERQEKEMVKTSYYSWVVCDKKSSKFSRWIILVSDRYVLVNVLGIFVFALGFHLNSQEKISPLRSSM